MDQKIKNFVIIAHIDHGKSTLADRLLELTGTVMVNKMRPQYLDMMDLEREKGITIKLQPVRMEYDKKYILNLIDTPGHVDFSYEVSRSLAAVEGAILLVDATKGIQAQTLANLELAKKQGLTIIPAINKIDMPAARVEETEKEMSELLGIEADEIIKISAKKGENILSILKSVIDKVPEPKIDEAKPLRALIFDSKFDAYKGIIAYVRIVDGKITPGKRIRLMATNAISEAKEVGYFKPDMFSQKELLSGEIGYIATGIKEPDKVRVGDTITIDDPEIKVQPLPGYKEVEPMVFASLYPENSDDFDLLKDSLNKLKLNDPALVFEPEMKEALGRGFRCGFLGTLHTEIVSERLHRDAGINLVISMPSVVYKLHMTSGEDKYIYSANNWPDPAQIKSVEEPWVLLEVVSPLTYIGALSDILKTLRGMYIDTKYLGSEKVILVYEVPLREIITNVYDKIKGASQGYGSMNYKFLDYRFGKLVKLDVYIAGDKEEAFSKIVPEERTSQEGRVLVEKIKEFLPPQQFSVAIQAVIGGKIIARETVKAQRKDVTGYLYGGDYSRKRKLLEKQKKGKKKLQAEGKVRVPPKVFLEVFRG